MLQEAREAQDLVRGLEDWEREHVRGSPAHHTAGVRDWPKGAAALAASRRAARGDALGQTAGRRAARGDALGQTADPRVARGSWSGDATSQSLLQRTGTMRRSSSDAGPGLFRQLAA